MLPEPESIADACRLVLLTPEPRAKLRMARTAARAWERGALAWRFDQLMPPVRPGLDFRSCDHRLACRNAARLARCGAALLHALAHIEFGAVDLAFDIAGRFGALFPRSFTDDWLAVGADEAMHFALLDRRLRTLGSFYGALPAHGGLWEAAEVTAHDPLARLAVVPMVLEARGRHAGHDRFAGASRRCSVGCDPASYLSGRDQACRRGHTLVRIRL